MIITCIVVGMIAVVFPFAVWIMKWTRGCWAETLAIFSFIFGMVGFLICSGMGLANIISKDVEYEKILYEREVLEYRLEHKDEFENGNEFLYSEITEFNNGLRSTKKWALNPWTNLFFNEKVATIDYIELE